MINTMDKERFLKKLRSIIRIFENKQKTESPFEERYIAYEIWLEYVHLYFLVMDGDFDA